MAQRIPWQDEILKNRKEEEEKHAVINLRGMIMTRKKPARLNGKHRSLMTFYFDQDDAESLKANHFSFSKAMHFNPVHN